MSLPHRQKILNTIKSSMSYFKFSWRSITVLILFTLAVYHFGPNAPRRRILASAPGALIGVALWIGVTRLFALYIENFDSYKTVYGALAGAAIYLIFLFLTCVSLLNGAEVNEQIYAMRQRHREARAAATDTTQVM